MKKISQLKNIIINNKIAIYSADGGIIGFVCGASLASLYMHSLANYPLSQISLKFAIMDVIVATSLGMILGCAWGNKKDDEKNAELYK